MKMAVSEHTFWVQMRELKYGNTISEGLLDKLFFRFCLIIFLCNLVEISSFENNSDSPNFFVDTTMDSSLNSTSTILSNSNSFQNNSFPVTNNLQNLTDLSKLDECILFNNLERDEQLDRLVLLFLFFLKQLFYYFFIFSKKLKF